MKKFGNWSGATAVLLTAKDRIFDGMERIVSKRAKLVRKSMVTGIAHKRFNLAPNAPSTIRRKGSSTPLVDKGDLVGNIVDEMVDRTTAFVGAKRGVKNKEGGEIANIFAVHTFGAEIKRGNRVIVIPKRDAITPAMEENLPEFEKEVKDFLGSVFRP